MVQHKPKFSGKDQELPPQTFPLVQTEEGIMVEAFGHLWPPQNDISIHLNCYRFGIKKAQGGLGPTRHMFEAQNLIWPERYETLNPWMVKRYQTFCKGHRIISLAGGAGSAKSNDVAHYALLWWWANPEERTVLICSTTIRALRQRIWSYITEAFYSAKGMMPGIVRTHPVPQILYDRRDEKHGIHGIPLKEGEQDRTLREVIGIHPKEALLVVVDEATDVTPAILEGPSNWDKGGVKFQMIVVGNPKTKMDPHGKLSTPKLGWGSVNPDTSEEWETKEGVCLYFDCYKSPRITEPYGHKLPFLISKEEIEKEEKRLGKDDPKFWRFVRGFWPRDDTAQTVLTLSKIETHFADKPATWRGDWQILLAALDPAFTSEGDECILRFATMGVFENGKVGLDFGGEKNILSLSLEEKTKEPITYQIVRLTRMHCKDRGVEPEHFGADTWGFGIGAGDMFEREWSGGIHRIASAGGASDRYVDSEMGERANEVYDRRITELWFAMRTFVEAGQIRGLDEATIEELCSREYEWKGRKISLEKKPDYKARTGRQDSPTGSPDRADAAVLLLEVARLNGLMPGERESDAGGMGDRYDWERRWENERGVIAEDEREREGAWSGDAILDSMSFGEKWEESI